MFSWTLVGNTVYVGCQWAMLAVLAKLGTIEAVGQFTLGIAVTTPVLMLTNLQLRYLQATDVQRPFRFGDYLGLRLVTTALAAAVIATIAFAGTYEFRTISIILAVGLAKTFESFSDVIHGLFQKHEQLDRIARWQMAKGVLSLVLLAGAVVASQGALWGAVALAATWGAYLFLWEVPAAVVLLRARQEERFLPRWNGRVLAELAWLALPLGITMMLASLNTSIPRYLIERHYGVRELGIFAGIAYLPLAGNILVSALGQAVLTRLSHYHTTSDRPRFRQLVGVLVGLAMVIGLGGLALALLAGKDGLALLYRDEYAAYKTLLVLIMASSIFTYAASILGVAATASRRYRYQSLAQLLVVLATSLSSWVLIRRFGMDGAGYSAVVSAFLSAAAYSLLFLSPPDP